MDDKYAYISRHHLAADRANERLHAAGLGAFFRPSQLSEAGLTPDQLPSLVRRRVVEHVTRGLYRLLDAEPTENYSLAMACARVPNSIVCLLSALRVHGIGSQAPAHVWLGIPQGPPASPATAAAAHRPFQRPRVDLRCEGCRVRGGASAHYRPGPYRRRLLQARETGRPGDRHRGTSRRAQKASRHYRRAFPGRTGPAVQAPACASRDALSG